MPVINEPLFDFSARIERLLPDLLEQYRTLNERLEAGKSEVKNLKRTRPPDQQAIAQADGTVRATKQKLRELSAWMRDRLGSSGMTLAADLAVLRHRLTAADHKELGEPLRRLAPAPPQPPAETPISLSQLPSGSWLLEVQFELVSDLICKDDRDLSLADIPIKKDRVYGYPEYWAPSWKGILRQAFRMRFGEEQANGFRLSKGSGAFKQDERLFGTPKDNQKEQRSGRLRFFTTRFAGLGFAVIHPTGRAPRPGTPILYETVPPKTPGLFRLLYCPWEAAPNNGDFSVSDAEVVGAAVRQMFDLGIGAKSSAGFGEVKVVSFTCECRGGMDDLASRMKGWVGL